MQLGNPTEALDLLQKGLEMTTEKKTGDLKFEKAQQRQTGILQLISECYVKMKDYEMALSFIKQVHQPTLTTQVLKLTTANEGYSSESNALVLEETAKIYEFLKDYENAVDCQKQSISKGSL